MRAYWQLAPGLTFSASDNKRTIVLPTGFFELEFGHEDWGAISLALEVVPYRDLYLGTLYDPETWTYDDLYDESGTEVSWYLGAKGAGWKGSLIFAALMLTLGMAMSN